MSLILDALKRAERERRAGQAPMPLDSIPVPQPDSAAPGARRWLLPALLGAVLAGGLVYAVIALRPPPAAGSAVVATVAVAAPVPPQPQAPTPTPPAAAATGETAIGPAAGIATLDDLVDDGGKPVRDAGGTPAKATPPPDEPEARGASVTVTGPGSSAAPPPSQDELPPSMQPESGADGETLRAPPAAPAPARPLPAAEPVQATPALPGPSSTDGARSFREMSPNYRAEFPALSFDVHVYNDDPQRRFVILNGKRYREGDTIAEGPKIVGIIADGVVFDWRGERVMYSLPR